MQKKEIHDFILYFFTNGYLNIVPKVRRNIISPITNLGKIKVIIRLFAASFVRIFIKNAIPKDKTWFFIVSSNNYNAVKSIYELLDESIFVAPHSFNNYQNYNAYSLNFRYKFFYNLLFPFLLLKYNYKDYSKGFEFYDLLYKTNGTYEECRRVLKRFKPKAIIFSNDHDIIPRALLLAAKEMNIPTHYVQHASVSKYFPPLSFDYALLEGEDSKYKYLNIGNSDSRIELIGMPKFDEYVNFVNSSDIVRSIGIAYNILDNLTDIQELISKLKLNFPQVNIIVRGHPTDKKTFPDTTAITISDSRLENSFEFLKQIDLLIASNTSMHLEAVLMNVYSISYNLSSTKMNDYYGFIKNKMIEHKENFESLNDLIGQLINDKPDIQFKASYYVASINSEFYGTSSRLAAAIISNSISSVR